MLPLSLGTLKNAVKPEVSLFLGVDVEGLGCGGFFITSTFVSRFKDNFLFPLVPLHRRNGAMLVGPVLLSLSSPFLPLRIMD